MLKDKTKKFGDYYQKYNEGFIFEGTKKTQTKRPVFLK